MNFHVGIEDKGEESRERSEKVIDGSQEILVGEIFLQVWGVLRAASRQILAQVIEDRREQSTLRITLR